MVFEYKSGSLEVVESVWTFSIPSIGLSNPFLLVGQTVEPSVNFDRAYLSFKTPLLLGKSAKTIIVTKGKYLLAVSSCCYHCCCWSHACYCLVPGVPAKATVYMINNEHTPYQFMIINKTLHAEGYTGHLRVNPTDGTIPANSK